MGGLGLCPFGLRGHRGIEKVTKGNAESDGRNYSYISWIAGKAAQNALFNA